MKMLIPRAAIAVLVLVALTGSLQAAQSGDAMAGKEVFTARCRTCHGDTGDGNAAMARALQVDIKPLKSEEVQAKSDDELKMIITEGTGKMRAVANLESADVDNVIAFIRSLKE